MTDEKKIWISGGMKIERRKPKCLEKNLSQVPFVLHKYILSTWTGLRENPAFTEIGTLTDKEIRYVLLNFNSCRP
jgi:hypothetical protein